MNHVLHADTTLAPLVASEQPLINLDATLLINIGLWLLLFIILRGLLWAPMLKLIRDRESGMKGSRTKAETLQKDSAALKAKYEAALADAQIAAAKAREEIRSDAQRKEAEILSKARESANAHLDTQRAELRTHRATLQTEIKTSIPQLAKDIATRVLGREVAA